MEHVIAILITLLIIGAFVGGWLHAMAIAVDIFFQSLIWDAPIGVTISSRAGLAARNGKPFGAKCINFIMFNKNHCEESIAEDIRRAQEALTFLTK